MRLHVAYRTGLAITCAMAAATALAQTQPSPGPTKPPPVSSPLEKPGTDMAINPTTEQCREGWKPSLKWTKAQFDRLCAQIDTGK